MKIAIKEPWYSAWQKFGWTKGMWGVGINSKDVETATQLGEDIDLAVGKSKYKIKPEEVKAYAEANGTKFRARYNTMLYVIPENMLGSKK